MSARTKGIIAIIASAFGFAVMAVCVRLCDDYGDAIPCFEKSFFRNAVALAIASFAFFGGRYERQPRGVWPLLLVRSVLGTIGIFANFYALSHIPIADGQTLNKTAPFFTVIFAYLLLGERINMRQLAAVIIAFAGTVLVARPGFAGAETFPLMMGLTGGVCAGGAYAAVRALGARKVSPPLIVFVFSAFSCLMSIPFAAFTYVPLTAIQVIVLTGAGLGAAIGQFGITLAYRFARPGEIAVYDYLNIVFTAIMGYLVFGQVSDPFAIIGMLVIIFAAFVLNFSRQEKEVTHEKAK